MKAMKSHLKFVEVTSYRERLVCTGEIIPGPLCDHVDCEEPFVLISDCFNLF